MGYTTKFDIDKYIAEYLNTAYGHKQEDGRTIVTLPSNIYLYHTLCSLTRKQPANGFTLQGNIEISLSDCQIFTRKDPKYYNYISPTAAKIFNKTATLFFRSTLHEYLDRMKHVEGLTYKEAAFLFVCKYEIDSIEPESLIKNHQRWISKIRSCNTRKKEYTRR